MARAVVQRERGLRTSSVLIKGGIKVCRKLIGGTKVRDWTKEEARE